MEFCIIGLLSAGCIAAAALMRFLSASYAVEKRKETLLAQAGAYYGFPCVSELSAMADMLSSLDDMLSGSLDPEETEAALILEQMDRWKKQIQAQDGCLTALLTGYSDLCQNSGITFRCKLDIPELFRGHEMDCIVLYDCLLGLTVHMLPCGGQIKVREASRFGMWHLQLSLTCDGTKLDPAAASKDPDPRASSQSRRCLKRLLGRYRLKGKMKRSTNGLEIDIIT